MTYDPAKVSYRKLLEVYWQSFDPTDADGQFADRGPQYRPVIFTTTPEQRRLAEASKRELQASGHFDRPIVVPIEPAGDFWPAEDYHQKYYLKNPGHYKAYRKGSGRSGFLKMNWGDKAH